MVLNAGANQYSGPTYSAKACFMAVGNITTTVNKGRGGVGPNERSISLNVYDHNSLLLALVEM